MLRGFCKSFSTSALHLYISVSAKQIPQQKLEILQMPFCVCVCCRFDDFDDAIDEAIEEDISDLCGGEWMM